MTEIVLMRHGHALSAHEAGVSTDPERPLSPLGEKEVLETVLHLKASGFVPDLIVSSPFLRADRTAAIAAGVFPGAPLRKDSALSDGRLQSVLDLLQLSSAGGPRLLLVGHQPLLGAIAAVLLGTEAFDVPPAGFVRLLPAAEAGHCSLVEYYTPLSGGKKL
ncbi:MAG: histidine phosphatase family protein [Elusimicrobia bacterium]|nr:histidine phosphatase family protein [Elusimicrobiota bacterium]